MSGGPPPNGSGTIRLERKKAAWSHRLVKYSVLIDGETTGPIANGEIRQFPVTPGKHTIRLVNAKYWMSPEKTVVLGEDQLVQFFCGPNGPAIAAIVQVFRVHNFIVLDGPIWPAQCLLQLAIGLAGPAAITAHHPFSFTRGYRLAATSDAQRAGAPELGWSYGLADVVARYLDSVFLGAWQ